ncbi:MAG: hypothetical protein ACI4TK_18780 [Agathobacter sp.]
MIRSVDYQVRLMEFHNGRIREMVVPNEDGSYTIFIESSLSREEQQQAFLHAMRHICNRDFEKTCSANLIEISAHR